MQTRDYGAASAKQSEQQTELFRSEFDRLGSASDGAGSSIHFDISETMDFMRVIGKCERWLSTPEESFDACEKFEEAGMETARPRLLYTSRRGRRSRW